jgi:hypothetical protein
MSSVKVKKETQKQTLYDVDYTITLNGFTVIAADSVEAAKAIAEDVANLPALYRGAKVFKGAVVTDAQASTKAGETSDNVGLAIIAVPRCVVAA